MKRTFPFHSNAVWPTLPMVMFFGVIYGLLEASFWLLKHLITHRLGDIRQNFADPPELSNIRLIILGSAAGWYAFHRLRRFHPACNQRYSQWLKMTPWTADKPLPLGPIHLVWQDAVVIGVLSLITKWHAHGEAAMPVVVFGAVYLGGLSFLLTITRRWLCCLLLGFLWPALVLPFVHGWLAWGIFLAILVVIARGQKESLRTFPWNFIRQFGKAASILQIEIRTDRLTGAPTAITPLNVGWPFLALSPKVNFYPVTIKTALSLSVLFGWWSYCVITAGKMDCMPATVVVLAVLGAIVRAGIYCSSLAPSFNVWGRIRSGRLLVPGFDRVFLTPLFTILLSIIGAAIIDRSGDWFPEAESIVIALIWLTLIGGGPDLHTWVLTGWHRFRVPGQKNANKQLQPI